MVSGSHGLAPFVGRRVGVTRCDLASCKLYNRILRKRMINITTSLCSLILLTSHCCHALPYLVPSKVADVLKVHHFSVI